MILINESYEAQGGWPHLGHIEPIGEMWCKDDMEYYSCLRHSVKVVYM